MGSSLVAGLATVPDACEAAVVALVDQPLVGAAAVRRLIAAFRGGATVAVAAYGGRPRNPVLLARPHWGEVSALAAGDAGAREFLRARPDLVTLVECGDTGRPDDIDTSEDLARIAGLLAGPGLRPGPDPGRSADQRAACRPQLVVTASPGASVSRSVPVTKAFGGQVIGSMASARRARPGPSASPVNTCSHRYPGPAQNRSLRGAGPAEPWPRPGPPGVAAQPGEGVIQAGPADRAGRPEVEGRPGHVGRRRGRDAARVGLQPGRGGQLKLPAVHRAGPATR